MIYTFNKNIHVNEAQNYFIIPVLLYVLPF